MYSKITHHGLRSTAVAVLLMAATCPAPAADDPLYPGADDIAKGRYLVSLAGCNDCHTAGYAHAEGKIPEAQWLTGDPLGWQGPWGTTYAINLRLLVASLGEDDWVKLGRNTRARPPMPGWVLREMTEDHLRAIYRFIRHLGPAGEPAPAYVPPDQQPTGPVVTFPAPPPS